MTTLSGALPEDHFLRFGHHCFLAGKTRAESRSLGPNKKYTCMAIWGLEWLLCLFVVSLISFGSTFQIRFIYACLGLRNIVFRQTWNGFKFGSDSIGLSKCAVGPTAFVGPAFSQRTLQGTRLGRPGPLWVIHGDWCFSSGGFFAKDIRCLSSGRELMMSCQYPMNMNEYRIES